MKHIMCPTCMRRFDVDDGHLRSIVYCPNCSLSLNCDANVVPEAKPAESAMKTPTSMPPRMSPIYSVGLVGIPIVILMLVVFLPRRVSRTTPPASDSDQLNVLSRSQSTPFLTREEAIDTSVDQLVDQHWRPLPGGNSREDAKRVTRDILKARNWEEFEAVMEKHIREGR